ncbi:MAG: HlyD family type I secretion periplasmic adaptor subunit [Halorhodospira halophila]|uniref:HlyD family type I secretion periplasmic adaptor subunit n=1 Tax=Halorhodospira halophila TaxID=1053 RepID=UPI0026EB4D78|nr:HlyD family type I secretion periplasmic adaptor subunit [Halorhodospira halophila]MCC3751093.1 HlyD family type I secretion periplasmic adaptor subunit [Halorhodospira halophila]
MTERRSDDEHPERGDRPARRDDANADSNREGEVVERAEPREGELQPASGSGGSNAGPPPTNDRFPRMFGLGVILVAFFGVGGWAATAKIDGAVVAPGTVTVDSYRQTVQHLEGGIVERLHVRDGDVVERGDLLIQLDETQARAEYLMTWHRYVSTLARQARLEAELEGEEELAFPEQVEESAEQSEAIERVRRMQARQFETRRDALHGEIEVLEQRIDELGERIEGMEAQREAKLRSIDSLEEEIETKEELVEREAIPSSELRPLERELAGLEGEAGELRASIAASRIEIGEAQLQMIQTQREFQREVAADLGEASDQVDELEEELRALEDTLARKQIRAPVGGEVVNMQVHAERAVIQGGEPVLDLVPEGEPLVLEGEVRPQDVDNVHPGMTADVRFTAFSFRRTPVIEGEVTFVSADRIEEEDQEPYYKVRAVVEDEELAKLGDADLRPGMPADVMINTGERTPLQYLAKPITDAIARSFRED